MSKFTSDIFYGEDEILYVFSKDKFTKKEAEHLAKEEMFFPEDESQYYDVICDDGYVGFGYYTNYEGERECGWYCSSSKPSKKNHVPCYIFCKNKKERFEA